MSQSGANTVQKIIFGFSNIRKHVSGCKFAHTDPFWTSDGALESYERETHENEVETLKNINLITLPSIFRSPQNGYAKILKTAQN